MKCVVVFALLIASVSAINRLDKMRHRLHANAKGQWDIAEGITAASSVMGKVEGHEQSARDAWNGLSTADKSTITNPTTADRPYFEANHHPPAIIMGIQYPDMPIGGAAMQQLGDDLTTPTHVTAGTFGALFAAGEHGARNTFIANTHFGCLQFWHAMAPEPYRGNNYISWTNAQLSMLIQHAMQRIWAVAVAKLKAGNKDMAEFHLGRILHTIGDSYAPGHTVRGPSDCGKILVFQEYNAQKGNHAHGDSDKPTAHPANFQCTVTRIREVMAAWAACTRDHNAHCGYPAILDSTFEVDPAVSALDAGGSVEAYVGPDCKAHGTKTTVTAAGKTLTIYFPALAGKTKIAGGHDVATVCPNF